MSTNAVFCFKHSHTCREMQFQFSVFWFTFFYIVFFDSLSKFVDFELLYLATETLLNDIRLKCST